MRWINSWDLSTQRTAATECERLGGEVEEEQRRAVQLGEEVERLRHDLAEALVRRAEQTSTFKVERNQLEDLLVKKKSALLNLEVRV